MRTALVVAILIAVVMPSPCGSQGVPDFSGTWKVSDARTEAPPPPPPPPPDGGPLPPPPPQLRSLTIVQTRTELRIDRTMALGDRTGVFKFVYKLDGTETTNQMGPITTKSKAAWDGPKLVVSSEHFAGDRRLGDSIDVHTLESGTLVIESTRNAPVGTITSKTVLRKEP